MNYIPAPLFPLAETTIAQRTILTNVIEDKWSKYTVMADLLADEKAHKSWMSELKKDKYFRNATHNSYARRVKLADGSIVESSNDDGETWAGQIILREMQRVNAVNTNFLEIGWKIVDFSVWSSWWRDISDEWCFMEIDLDM